MIRIKQVSYQSTFKTKTEGARAMAHDEFSKQATEGEKYLRDTLCKIATQPAWLLWLPFRWLIAEIAGLLWGARIKQTTWKTITLANIITLIRFLLLAFAIKMFAENAPLADQTKMLFWAIITDIFDGAAARNNNEVTALGTYMDHTGDWSVVIWVIFLIAWHINAIPFPLLMIAFLIIPVLFVISMVKFNSFYDPESSFAENISGFAIEELQTDFWGRIQFSAFSVALFGALFLAADLNPLFFAEGILRPLSREFQLEIVYTALGIYLVLGGYSARDALDYSETQAKKFKEKLHKMKAGSQ